MQLSDLDPAILSDLEISQEISLIGERWKLLWSEQAHRKEQQRQKANAAMDQDAGCDSKFTS
jgi:DNA-binding transcriptional regulator/RsmH inhibitor MraZ